MEREKGEYLDMDEDKRRQLDEQAAEYVDDVPAMPAMNADDAPDGDKNEATGDPADTPEPTES